MTEFDFAMSPKILKIVFRFLKVDMLLNDVGVSMSYILFFLLRS